MSKQIIEQKRAEWEKSRDDFAKGTSLWLKYQIRVHACDELLKEIKPCTWTLADHGAWETGCGINTDLSPDHPKMKYCPYCGNEIEEAGK